MKMLKVHLLLITAILLPSFAFATVYVEQIHEFAISSQEMEGMGVTAVFGDSTTNTGTWANLSSNQSGVIGNGWSITNTADPSFDDDTMYNTWTLTSSAGIQSLTINAITADIVFDIIFSSNPDDSTPISSNGWWDSNGYNRTQSSGSGFLYQDSSGTYFIEGSYYDDDSRDNFLYFSWSFSQDITVVGMDQINPLDVWGEFTLNFDNPETDNIETFIGTLNFDLDTDATTVVPEPTTLMLLGLGLLGFSALGRRKI